MSISVTNPPASPDVSNLITSDSTIAAHRSRYVSDELEISRDDGRGTLAFTATLYASVASAVWSPRLNTGRWAFNWTPATASTDAVWASTYYILFDGISGGLYMFNSAGARQLRLYNTSSVLQLSQTLTWAAGTRMRIIVDSNLSTVTIIGATTGDDTYSFTPTSAARYFNTGNAVGFGFDPLFGPPFLPSSTFQGIDDGGGFIDLEVSADSVLEIG